MAGYVKGAPKIWLRGEGFCVFVISVLAYFRWGDGWPLFALTFLLPDLSIIAYIKSKTFGAAFYNAAHSYVGPILCLAFGEYANSPFLVNGGFIWAAHIGFDRMLGYGLKYTSGFADTHLGRQGASANKAELAQGSREENVRPRR